MIVENLLDGSTHVDRAMCADVKVGVGMGPKLLPGFVEALGKGGRILLLQEHEPAARPAGVADTKLLASWPLNPWGGRAFRSTADQMKAVTMFSGLAIPHPFHVPFRDIDRRVGSLYVAILQPARQLVV
jgi:hypothetical protein